MGFSFWIETKKNRKDGRPFFVIGFKSREDAESFRSRLEGMAGKHCSDAGKDAARGIAARVLEGLNDRYAPEGTDEWSAVLGLDMAADLISLLAAMADAADEIAEAYKGAAEIYKGTCRELSKARDGWRDGYAELYEAFTGKPLPSSDGYSDEAGDSGCENPDPRGDGGSPGDRLEV